MPKSYFIFNGNNSTDYGMTIEQLPESIHAERRGQTYQIDGRNGTFVSEYDTFENYEQTYQFNIRNVLSDSDSYRMSRDIAAWLLSSSGFCRLEDTYEPEHYRLARYAGPLNIESILRRNGRGSIVFDCRPERFLKSGEDMRTLFHTVTSVQSPVSTSIQNPTFFSARPWIQITGTGSFTMDQRGPGTVAEMAITVHLSTEAVETIQIDCQTYDIYQVITVPITGGTILVPGSSRIEYRTTYPQLAKLLPGENTFTLGQYGQSQPNIRDIQIIPRWWTI